MTEPEAPRAAQHAHDNARTPEDQYEEERAPAAKQARDNRTRDTAEDDDPSPSSEQA
ncbi:MAG TPA: hypothetical protein VK935_05090 [Actinomycetospora sp.]|nr:hypothetical protein [Actinomycetospora sp.]